MIEVAKSGEGSGTSTPTWRVAHQLRQREVLPAGPTVVSSTGPYGVGGLGRHLAELVEVLRDSDRLAGYLSPLPRPEDVGLTATTVDVPAIAHVAQQIPPVRFSLGLRTRIGGLAFDAAASARLPKAKHLLVFNGHASRHIGKARRLSYQSVGLVSANSHLVSEARRHRDAYRQYPIERPWGPSLVRTNLAEYETADLVYVSSRYAWESFVDQGYPEDRLRFFPLTPHDRYNASVRTREVSTFNVVYVGSLSVHKGVPLLVDAVRRLPYDDLRLTLVGGWGTRGMRRFIEVACAGDPRIDVRPGDPLPHLAGASLCVHPSYADGFGYAPAEALACGVPVVVSEDTGMKELVRPGVDGWVVPTGDLDALTETIDSIYLGAAQLHRRERSQGGEERK
mgnify:CR=1 FL=1